MSQEITKRLSADPEIKQFMESQGMFVEEMNAIPEVRVITPSHLVRSGISTAYDANFGMEAGACAVMLLLTGQGGVTVSGYFNGTIHYMQIKDAIAQRHVDLEQVNLYEQLGFTFGRVRHEFNPKTMQVSGKIERIY